MKSIFPLLAAAASAQDSTLEVNLDIDNAEVARGSNVVYSCSWSLSADYADYEQEEFQLMWKADDQAVARYDNDEVMFYHGSPFQQDRANITYNFDEHVVELTLNDVGLEEDNMEMTCEVHWNRRFNDGSQVLNVYVDANEVDLEEHESVLEGRAHTDMNGTLTEVSEAQIATCNVFGVYPKPDKVVFLVGDNEEVVEDVVPTENADGLFDVSATLTIMPSSEYDNDQVSCVSQAAESAELVHSDVNSTFALDVSYYTNEVNLEISGANQDAQGNYYIIENEAYTVHCSANGNPEPEINVYGPDGLPITSGAEAIASRSESLQHITCTANNNDDEYNMGDDVTTKKQLSVYYLDEPTTTVDSEYEYGSTVTMECAAEGNPAPKYTWLKDGEVIKSGDTLTIDAIKYSDAGAYTCKASNEADSAETTTDVTVDGPCIVQITSKTPAQSQTANAAASLTLKCNVEGPNCDISWESATEPELVAQGAILAENENGFSTTSSLFFEAIDKRINPVEFKCIGENDYGSVSDSVTVDEKDEPVCCDNTTTGNLGTGAIVGIVIAIPAVLIIIGAVVFFCRNKQPGDDTKSDLEEADEENEPSEKAPLTEGNGGEGGNAGDDEQV